MKKDNLDLFVEQLLSEVDSKDNIEDVNDSKESPISDELIDTCLGNIKKFADEYDDLTQGYDIPETEQVYLNQHIDDLLNPENVKTALDKAVKSGRNIDVISKDPFKIYRLVKNSIKQDFTSSLYPKKPSDNKIEKPKKIRVGSDDEKDEVHKWDLPIQLTASDGKTYVLTPAEHMKDIHDLNKISHHPAGVTPQRGFTRGDRLTMSVTPNDINPSMLSDYSDEIKQYDKDKKEIEDLEKEINSLKNEKYSFMKIRPLLKLWSNKKEEFNQKYPQEKIDKFDKIKKYLHNKDNINNMYSNVVGNAIIIPYSEYRKRPDLQKLLGDQLEQFYKDHNVKPEERPLDPFNNKLIDDTRIWNFLIRNPKIQSEYTNLDSEEARKKYRNEKIKEYKKIEKARNKEYYPAAASVPKATDINTDPIEKRANYNANKNEFHDWYDKLDYSDKKLFQDIQKVVTEPLANYYSTNPEKQWSTKMSPKDLLLLKKNFKQFALDYLNSKGARDEQKKIRDKWQSAKLDAHRNEMKSMWGESFLKLMGLNILTEKVNPIPYEQNIIMDVIDRSGVYFNPFNYTDFTSSKRGKLDDFPNIRGMACEKIFQNHWQEIPVINGRSDLILQGWYKLLKEYYSNYANETIVNWLKEKGYIQDKSQIESFANTPEGEKIMAKLIKSADLDKITQANLEKESKYDEMITKVLKDLIAE